MILLLDFEQLSSATIWALIAAGCGPVGEGDQAPAFLTVDKNAIVIGPEDDAKMLEVSNTGGQTATFTVEVAATAAGTDWLTVEPASGVVTGGGSKTLLVMTKNREKLPPGTYHGEIKITQEGGGSETVDVSMTAGQPVLFVEPSDTLDFGDSEASVTLLLKNTGSGALT